MKFSIVITSEAQRNIIAAFEHILADSEQNAGRWLQGIYETIDTLEAFPRRCATAQEQRYYPKRELRQLAYKSHRIIFEVNEAQAIVRVLYVRHGKMRAIGDPGTDTD
jgi:plasmid stabilization system protein ParE